MFLAFRLYILKFWKKKINQGEFSVKQPNFQLYIWNWNINQEVLCETTKHEILKILFLKIWRLFIKGKYRYSAVDGI